MLSTFWTWLRKQSHVSVNPFELVERADTRGKHRIQRRALSDAKSVRLRAVAGKNQLAYMLPLYAGLRRNEFQTLRWSDLVLGESGGLLRLHAAVNKNRKEQRRPQASKAARGRLKNSLNIVVNNQDYLDRLQVAVSQLHNCGATWRETVPVHEVFCGQTVWQGEVEVFDLTGHPKTKRCYGWSHRDGKNDETERFVTVLEIPPVESALNQERK